MIDLNRDIQEGQAQVKGYRSWVRLRLISEVLKEVAYTATHIKLATYLRLAKVALLGFDANKPDDGSVREGRRL